MSNYEGIAQDCSVTVELRAEEAAAVLKAYDYGLNQLNADQRHALDVVMAKLKDQIWP